MIRSYNSNNGPICNFKVLIGEAQKMEEKIGLKLKMMMWNTKG